MYDENKEYFARMNIWIGIAVIICFLFLQLGSWVLGKIEKSKSADSSVVALVKNYETLERAYDAIVKETNALREERDRLQKRVDLLEAELSTKEKSKTTGEELDHRPHICFRCYQNLNDKLTKDEMIVEENLLLERARIMKFTRWRMEILPKALKID